MDNQTRGIDPISILEGGKDTFKQRSAPYGEAYKRFGHIMMSFFPGGLTLSNADEWNRYACFHMVVAKMARYANCFHEGHIDSSHDSMVYSAMLESLDHEQGSWHMKQDEAQPIIPGLLREIGEASESDASAEEVIRGLESRLRKIQDIIWSNGAALGSDAYFKVRALAAGIDCEKLISE